MGKFFSRSWSSWHCRKAEKKELKWKCLSLSMESIILFFLTSYHREQRRLLDIIDSVKTRDALRVKKKEKEPKSMITWLFLVNQTCRILVNTNDKRQRKRKNHWIDHKKCSFPSLRDDLWPRRRSHERQLNLHLHVVTTDWSKIGHAHLSFVVFI